VSPNDPSQQYILVLNNFFLTFTSILFEALPWVVLGTALAGIVQEVPSRRAPAVMLALSTLIIVLFVAPFHAIAPGYYIFGYYLPDMFPTSALYAWDIAAAIALAGCVLWGLLLIQPVVDQFMHILGRHRFLAILGSGFLGAVIPMCECGIIPVTRRLLRKGLPLSCCVTYILAGPIVNVVVLLTTYVAFVAREGMNANLAPGEAPQMSGLWMMGLRALLGYLVAVITGFIAEFMHRRYGNSLLTPLTMPSGLPVVENDDVPTVSIWKSVSNMAGTALHDFVDITAYLILGALFAAAIKAVLSNEFIAEQSKDHAVLAILIMMGLAIVITLCSEADAFVAANFTTLRPAAKLAFIVLGPMLDFKLFFMYRRVFRPRMMYTIIGAVLIQVFLYSLLTHMFWETYAKAPPTTIPAVKTSTTN
jgi:uncharacterized membrane protein YraQ (UPF0718 family)